MTLLIGHFKRTGLTCVGNILCEELIMKTRIQKICHCGILVTALLTLSAAGEEVQTNYAGFGVVVETAHSFNPVGTPIVVTVMMTNGTHDSVVWDLPFDGCSCNYGYFEVKSLPAGTNLPCRWMQNTSRSGHEQVRQRPGDVSKEDINLTERYGMKEPGVYAVRLLGRMPVPIVINNNEPTCLTPPLIITITNLPTNK